MRACKRARGADASPALLHGLRSTEVRWKDIMSLMRMGDFTQMADMSFDSYAMRMLVSPPSTSHALPSLLPLVSPHARSRTISRTLSLISGLPAALERNTAVLSDDLQRAEPAPSASQVRGGGGGPHGRHAAAGGARGAVSQRSRQPGSNPHQPRGLAPEIRSAPERTPAP